MELWVEGVVLVDGLVGVGEVNIERLVLVSMGRKDPFFCFWVFFPFCCG